MSYLPNLLAFAEIWALIVISPGPDLIVTIRFAVAHSRQGSARCQLRYSHMDRWSRNGACRTAHAG